MTSFNNYLAQGNAWLFIPAAMVLGALHGLEPGHSKTIMAAFIVAIRGTVRQAVLLGVSATLSHTAVIWVLAGIGLHYSGQFNAEQTEPYFQIVTGVLVVGMAFWMFARTHREVHAAENYAHAHGKQPSHPHEHPPNHDPDEHHHPASAYQDDHERGHAEDIEKRFANRPVTTGQLILFGLTGGLLPCPAAFAVLLVCLQLKKFTLGFALVLAFSVGLALTLVTVGSVAALSVRHAARQFKGFGKLARKLPYVSSTVMILIGLFVAVQGFRTLLY